MQQGYNMEKMTLTIAGNEYELGWSLSIYKKFKDITGVDFNHIRACIFNELNDITSAIGKPPAYHAKVNKEKLNEHTIYYTYDEYANALADYNVQFDLELTRRVTEHVSLETAAAILYAAANGCNSRVELAEMEENVFIEGIKPTEKTQGYQYLITQYVSWTYTLGQESEETDVKKPLGGSLLKKLLASLTT
jgi:hypothetical protein